MDGKQVAALAKLALSRQEEQAMEAEFAAILHFARAMDAVNTTGVEATARVHHGENALREDAVEASCPRAVMLQNAPDAAQGYISVPRAFDGGGEA